VRWCAVRLAKLKLLAFAIYGFIVGVAAYFILDWMQLSSLIQAMSIEIVLTPWTISGLIGAILYFSVYVAFSRWDEKDERTLSYDPHHLDGAPATTRTASPRSEL
jgi:H+/Cl- antiporter ClcA